MPFSILDRAILSFDRALRTLAAPPRTLRPTPGADEAEVILSEGARRHTAALMRINHVGEVCAQALYQGQSVTARTDHSRAALEQAANEETEHLAWTLQRIQELGGRTSLLNPLWYAGSLSIGLVAGLAGDRWSLGFLAETERQVEAHLSSHLGKVPAEDLRTRSILSQMKADETAHAEMAVGLGGSELPPPVRGAMRLASRVMTTLAYHM